MGFNKTSTNNAANLPEVCLLGCGSFGTAVARIVADNLVGQTTTYAPRLKLWARRETLAVDMMASRENKQYLPTAMLPDNIHVSSSLKDVVSGCSVVIIGIPSHHITPELLHQIGQHAGDDANLEGGSKQDGEHSKKKKVIHVVSLAKGMEFTDGKIQFVSDLLSSGLFHPKKTFVVSVLMGANVADQMGRNEFAEGTLGCPCPSFSAQLRALFHAPSRYSVTATSDVVGVELSGALKNVVALAAGFVQGLNLGSNTTAAVVRVGFLEILRFAKTFFVQVHEDTFLESSGIADLMTTCFAGRGRRVAAAFIKANQEKSWETLEKELLNGQNLPDWHNAQHVFHFLYQEKKLEEFPLFNAVYRIGFENHNPMEIVDALQGGKTTTLKQTKTNTSSTEMTSSTAYNISFEGKRALVTGAGTGIGLAIATLLSQLGARVIGLDRDIKALEELKRSTKCEIIQVDLMDISALNEKLHLLQHDPPQLIVNCAGIAAFQPFFETDVASFDRTYAVNTRAVVFLTQIIAQQLVAVKLPGSVVHISSQSSTLALTEHIVYSSSKAALDHIARIQALELGKMNIRVNVVRPTVVLTQLALQNWKKEDLDKMKTQIPLGRLAEPVDVAKTVAWLLSDHASMITGEAIAIDGGRSMGGFNGL
jgi:NAD-dependent glycerol-3-phosphate dehydrogenase